MVTFYQIICLGEKHSLQDKVIEVLLKHIAELGVSTNLITIIDENNFEKDYKKNAPSYCLYFGRESNFRNIEQLKTLVEDATLILPIVSDLNRFSKQIPEQLKTINGYELTSEDNIEGLVSCILEGLSLIRSSRRLFISYRRNESSTVAIQLFEKLEKAGFDVFLDTHSVSPGSSFQDELWHRMVDTDVVVLLNTPGFMTSNWTKQELAKANAMSIGVVQLIWPTHNLESEAKICIPIKLTKKNFKFRFFDCSYSGRKLCDDVVREIISKTESLRARTLAARQDNIVKELISSAKRTGKLIDLHPEKYLTITKSDGSEIIIFPTVGVPHAFTYDQSKELLDRMKRNDVGEIFLLFDHANIRERWIKHLDWLDRYLPIKTIKIVDVEKWLTSF